MEIQMEAFLEKLKKFDTPLAWGIAAAVYGICFIALPSHVLDIILLITGILVIALAVARLIVLLARPSRRFSFIAALVINALVLLFGISLTNGGSEYSGSICATLGTYLALLSLFRLVTAYRIPAEGRSKIWWRNTIMAVVMLVVGLWLVVYPVWPKILAGVALLTLSVEFIIRAVGHGPSGIAEAARDVFEGSFVDRSDE